MNTSKNQIIPTIY